MKLKLWSIVFAATLLTLSAGLFVTASGGVGGRPANPDPDIPRSQSIFIYTLKTGETKNDQIYLSNSSQTSETVLSPSTYNQHSVYSRTG